MNELKNIIETIKKAAVVELRMGYKNAAVFGGFSAFVVSSLSHESTNDGTAAVVKNIRLLMGKYAEAGNRERSAILNKALDALTSLENALNNESPDEPTGIQFLKSVGPKRARLLEKLGISKPEDLLYHFPRRYEDRSNLKKFFQLKHGDHETVMGTVVSCQDIRPRKGLTITKAAVNDGSSLGYVVWFNQPYIKKQIPQGTPIVVTGKVERKFGNVQISAADFEILDNDEPLHSGRIVPIYPATEGLTGRVLRSIIKNAAETCIPRQKEFLPPEILKKYGLLDLPDALWSIHFPQDMEQVEAARKRLVFEELFLQQVGVWLLKSSEEDVPGIKHRKNGPLLQDFLQKLPFRLTGAQQRTVDEITRDMEEDKPMNRLVQGDVGSGKTAVAAAALVKTVENGYQGAMMAPTEILATQHFKGLLELLEPLGIQVALLTGSMAKSEKNRVIDDISQGRVDIVVGTHAVIQEEIEFYRLGLAITDEQHRFGVRQRALLKHKGYNPDVLVMTATPIPRTLALTVYGDLDISIIDELPPGRQPVKTYLINQTMKARVYKFIKDNVTNGRQVFYVCPLVEESEKIDVRAVVELADQLQTKVFPELKIGLLHGRLKQDEKDTVMTNFKNGEIDILVATTVVEVGVNVPNATVIVIEDAERFGLAQLHQLRGRVGRSSHQSYCILVANPTTEEGKARMDVMQSTCDGFVIAEEDLKIRGPGEFFGTRQSGLPDLKIADIIKDVKILQLAREEAQMIIHRDPNLHAYQNLRQKVMEKFKGTDNYIKIS